MPAVQVGYQLIVSILHSLMRRSSQMLGIHVYQNVLTMLDSGSGQDGWLYTPKAAR